MRKIKISKYLSYILRHSPESINIEMDNHGWVWINDLIDKTTKYDLSYDLIKAVVKTNRKKRFSISEDGKRIRANQGHSLEIDLDLEEKEPPQVLYHGTAKRFLEKILDEGLKPMGRHDVHLSLQESTAVEVGKRYGQPVVLEIMSQKMYEDDIKFYESDNGVWLTGYVDPKYIRIQNGYNSLEKKTNERQREKK